MKICRYGDNRLGLVEGEQIRDISFFLDTLPLYGYPYPSEDVFVSRLDQLRDVVAGRADNGERVPLRSVRLLSPVANPGKLVAAPVNYQAHLREAIEDKATFSRAHVRRIQETGLFLKATSSLIGAGSAVAISHSDRRTDHEVELAVVIGRSGKDIQVADALSYVAGYAIGLDITIRGPEERSLRKSLDTYSVLGPWLVTPDELGDPGTLDLQLKVGDELRQQARTADLILNVPELISFASSWYTLHAGDIIYTGTPEGVGPILPGDIISASISRIGSMTVKVTAQ
jgi:2-keto-4-pentenoate hydratase/2-oxohepta-3-ene-1,7-dioic acid hydratase in catechol pathway